jgi:MFS transporter, Spinster family, sphingosine-1-phosphate transporter
MQSPDGTTPSRTNAALPGARSALMLLLAINLFNYVDRQVLAAVEPEIRKELLSDVSDQETAKFWMGLLSTAFLLTYMIIAPLFGWLADRMSRWSLIGFGVIVWSLASGASGWDWHADIAIAYWALLLTRCFVGVGEGAYGPIAPAMIADFYPVKKRGQVLAYFYLAIPVGGALGYAFGEIVQKTLGWRWAFYMVVPPGLALGLWCYFMRDPPRGHSENLQTPQRKVGFIESLGVLAIPSYLLNTLGMTAMTFAIGGLAWWMPGYLEEKQVADVAGIGPRTVFGIITALAGLLATLSGGLAGDWLRPKFSGSYFLVSGLAMLLGFPMLLAFLSAPFPLAWVFVFLTVFCLFFNTGPTNTILANVTHPSVRASGFALNILIIHSLGDAISPPIIGYIADQKDLLIFGKSGLDAGFLVVSLLMLVGGVLWLWGTRYLEKDTAVAPTRISV